MKQKSIQTLLLIQRNFECKYEFAKLHLETMYVHNRHAKHFGITLEQGVDLNIDE